MKKTFALVLALVMVFGCLFSVAPMAEATDSTGSASAAEKYVPEIAYSNVNYTKDLSLMFAVPAPAALDEGASVKVVVWSEASSLFSYNESVSSDTTAATATAIEAESAKATIDGKEYLVFKYSGLSADMMTNVIYARAVVVNAANKATAYGDVVDYSIVEYVKTAKGEFEGTPALSNAAVLDLLDAMVDFGTLAQIAVGSDEPYAPNGYFANDDLKKIWITPVVAGQTYAKVLGGFFKYEDGGFATVYAPFYDGLQIAAYKDVTGAVIEDANQSSSKSALGFQIEAVDGDVNLTVEYSVVPVRGITAEDFGVDFMVNNIKGGTIECDTDVLVKNNVYFNGVSVYFGNGKANLSGEACVVDKNGRYNYYHGIKTVVNPTDPDDLVFLITATNAPTIEFQKTVANKDFYGFGYGDTVESACTIEFEIGKVSADDVITTGSFFFRTREAGNKPLTEDMYHWAEEVTGETLWDTNASKKLHDQYVFKITNNVIHLQLDNSTRGEDIVTLPDAGLVKVAVTVYSSGEMRAYVADENGTMQLVANGVMKESLRFASFKKAYEKAVADGNAAAMKAFEPYANFGNWFAMNNLEPMMNPNLFYKGEIKEIEEAVVEIGGELVPTKNPDGTYNHEAVRIYAEQNYSFLLDNFRFFGGAIYE